MLVFAAISPHPPIILPSVGSKEDREKVKKTIESLEFLGGELKKASPDLIIISSPHPDWGFDVPLYFLARDFKGKVDEAGASSPPFVDARVIEQRLIGLESPQFYFEQGKKVYRERASIESVNYAVVASGDLSHCLKEDGPYGFQEDGPKFDKKLVESLKKKDIKTILKLDEMYPEAGECGLRSFCFLLGILEESGIDFKPEILSYEGPFGVGYLVADFHFSS